MWHELTPASASPGNSDPGRPQYSKISTQQRWLKPLTTAAEVARHLLIPVDFYCPSNTLDHHIAWPEVCQLAPNYGKNGETHYAENAVKQLPEYELFFSPPPPFTHQRVFNAPRSGEKIWARAEITVPTLTVMRYEENNYAITCCTSYSYRVPQCQWMSWYMRTMMC